MVCCYCNNTQEEEDKCLCHCAKHFDGVPNSGAGALGHIFFHIVLHGQGTGHNAVTAHTLGSGKRIHSIHCTVTGKMFHFSSCI